jgi:hypothetical protein
VPDHPAGGRKGFKKRGDGLGALSRSDESVGAMVAGFLAALIPAVVVTMATKKMSGGNWCLPAEWGVCITHHEPIGCQLEETREQAAKMYPASEWRVISGRMMMIRGCLSLLIATVVKDLVTSQVFRRVV